MSASSFDERAATWDDDPAKVERAEQVALAIRAAVPLDRSMRMLEYGAGTGLVTQALRDAVGPVTLVDTSTEMRKVIQAKITSGALTDARVVGVDLAAEPLPDEEFELIITVLALHHIPEVDVVLRRFSELLVDGGRLCIVDLDQEDGSFHGEGFDGHRGFSRTVLAADLADAGFTEVRFERCHEIVRAQGTYPLFLATGVTRPDAHSTEASARS